MPVSFLREDHLASYGRYRDDPTPAQLARYFFLDAADLARIYQHHGSHNRLRFAVQLGTVRFLGTFLTDLSQVPKTVVQHLAQQLALPDPQVLVRYGRRGLTRQTHAREIQQAYGYHTFTDQPGHFQFVRWLYTRIWLSDERPSVVFDRATAHLVEQRILLPGATVLARLIAQVRDRVASRVWSVLHQALTPTQQTALDRLLLVPPNGRITPLEQLRRAAPGYTSTSMLRALKRVETLQQFQLDHVPITTIPPARLTALARYAVLSPASTLARMDVQRRQATLFAFVSTMERTAIDDALDLLDALIMDLIRRAKLTARQTRLRTLKDLDAAALHLSAVCTQLLDPQHQDTTVHELLPTLTSPTQLTAAITTITTLARPPETTMQPELIARYQMVRRFLPTLLRMMPFDGTSAGRPVLQALAFLRHIEGQRDPHMRYAPRAVVPRDWRRFVFRPRRDIDRPAYTLCVLAQLQTALRCHDVFVTPSDRWGDVRVQLIPEHIWDMQRPRVCRMLQLPLTATDALARLRHELTTAFAQVTTRLPTNTAVRIVNQRGKAQLQLDRVTKLDESPHLGPLRDQMTAAMPRVDLAEVLLEVQRRTGFADACIPLGPQTTRMPDLALSVCAVLLAEACNIGLEPLVRADVPALTRRRLEWVQQTCIRAETLREANACLVDAQTTIPLAQHWGGGDVASVDGLRFVVPIQAVNTGVSAPYYGTARGITYLNFASDQFTGFYGMVVPGTLRDSPYILDGLLEHETSLRPTELMTDTAGYSDVVFGLFWLLGYQFSPRLTDTGSTRLWRMDRRADYGPFNAIATHVINTRLIETQWDDMLRVAGSLKLKTIRASTFIRAVLTSQRTATLARAIGELGRIAKTRFLLTYLDDATYRRRVLTQLNRSEARHRLAREVFYGRRGEVRQRYREGQEDQLGALGLVINVIILWNTWYMDRFITALREQGVTVADEDLLRLWPVGSRHLNLVGRYTFQLPDYLQHGAFRPFAQPIDMPTEGEKGGMP